MTTPVHKRAAPKEELMPRSTELEFGGLSGALFITITVPLTMYYLVFGCNETLGCGLSLPVFEPTAFVTYARQELVKGFTDYQSWAIYFAWYAYCVVAWFVLPGNWVLGLPLRTGGRLEYKTNGTCEGS